MYILLLGFIRVLLGDRKHRGTEFSPDLLHVGRTENTVICCSGVVVLEGGT